MSRKYDRFDVRREMFQEPRTFQKELCAGMGLSNSESNMSKRLNGKLYTPPEYWYKIVQTIRAIRKRKRKADTRRESK